MTFRQGSQLDTGQMSRGRRARGAPIAVGGGVGGLLIVLLVMFLGGGNGGGGGAPASNPWDYGSDSISDGEADAGGPDLEHCRTGADANESIDCRMVGAVNSVQDFWGDAMEGYEPTDTVLFEASVSTACGDATSAVGPFYCPADRLIYLDVSFFAQLEQLGADGGSLSQMYVVAHEYGHHVQNLTGVLTSADRSESGQGSDAVRVELQADCYAGAWVAHADGTRSGDADAMLEPVTQEQVESALSAAAAVGDDRIQSRSGGGVNPESWTHGSAEQRMEWFMVGYETGDPARCDTFGD